MIDLTKPVECGGEILTSLEIKFEYDFNDHVITDGDWYWSLSGKSLGPWPPLRNVPEGKNNDLRGDSLGNTLGAIHGLMEYIPADQKQEERGYVKVKGSGEMVGPIPVKKVDPKDARITALEDCVREFIKGVDDLNKRRDLVHPGQIILALRPIVNRAKNLVP